MSMRSDGEEVAPSWMNVAAAFVLFISPWFFDYAHHPIASWCAWASSIGILLMVGVALARSAIWGECATLILGLWLVTAPWILDFTHVPVAQWTHLVLGALVALFAGWTLKAVRSATA
jgi:hypothetical protein